MSDTVVEILFKAVGADLLLKSVEDIIGKLKAAADAVNEAAHEVDRFDDVMAHLRTPIEEANEALEGQIDKMTLAMAANKLTEAGVEVTGNQFRAMAVKAKEVADATGNEFEPTMQKLIRAIVTGHDRFHQFNLTGADGKEMLANLTTEFGHAGVAADSTADKIDALTHKWDDFVRDVERAVLDQGAVHLLIDSLDRIGNVMGSLTAGTIPSLGSAFINLLTPIGMVAHALDTVATIMERINPVTLGRSVGEWMNASASPGDNDADAAADVERRRQFWLSQRASSPVQPNVSSAPEAAGQPPGRRRRGAGGGGGGGGGNDPEEDRRIAASRAGFDRDQENADRLDALREQTHDKEREALEGRLEMETQHAERREEIRAEELLKMQRGLQAERRMEDERKRMAKEKLDSDRQLAAETVGAAFEAGKNLASAAGASKAALLVLTGIEETVYAAAAWAMAVTPGGQAYIPGAIAHTAAAATAFAEAAGMGGGGGGHGGGGGGFAGAGAGPGAAASGGPVGGQRQGDHNTYVIHMQGFMDKRGASQMVLELIEHGRAMGKKISRASVED